MDEHSDDYLGRRRPGRLFEHRREILRPVRCVTYTYGNRYSNCDCDVDSYRDVHANSDSNSHSDIYANSDRYPTAQPDAAAYPRTKSSPHSTAAPNAAAVQNW
jgi:hypothetical protein